MCKLPHEIIDYIFSYFTVNDYYNFALVSKESNFLINYLIDKRKYKEYFKYCIKKCEVSNDLECYINNIPDYMLELACDEFIGSIAFARIEVFNILKRDKKVISNYDSEKALALCKINGQVTMILPLIQIGFNPEKVILSSRFRQNINLMFLTKMTDELISIVSIETIKQNKYIISTIINIACQYNNIKFMKYVIYNDIYVNHYDVNSCLLYACANNSFGVVILLLNEATKGKINAYAYNNLAYDLAKERNYNIIINYMNNWAKLTNNAKFD